MDSREHPGNDEPQHEPEHERDYLSEDIDDTISASSSISSRNRQPAVPFYRRPGFQWLVLTSVNAYFLLPFIQGLMLGFGEICASELSFRLGWFRSRRLLAAKAKGIS